MEGEPVPFSRLCDVFQYLEGQSGRLLKIKALCNFYRSVIALTPENLIQCVYLSVNKLAPAYEGIELGIGDSLVLKAICDSTGSSLKMMRKELSRVGDLGLVAEGRKSTQKTLFKPKPLDVVKVYRAYRSIAESSGANVNGKKVDTIKSLLVSAGENQVKFIVRGLQGQLRIGCSEITVIHALAHAIALTPPNTKCSRESMEEQVNRGLLVSEDELAEEMQKSLEILKRAHSEAPNWEKIIPALVEYGIDGLLDHCHLTPGVPVKAMLAKPSSGVSDILKRLGELSFTLEYKYDGERAQIHLSEDGSIKIFSRNLEDNTGKYPDLVPIIRKVLGNGVKSVIVDSEVVAYNRETKRIEPFQILSTRKRKDVMVGDIKVTVCLFAFDLLYLNGQSLLQKSFKERRDLLHSTFSHSEGEFHFATFKDTNDCEEIETFFQLAKNSSCEGLMVKTLEQESTYEPDKRSHNWLKMKKDYIESSVEGEKLPDTVDLVPIGAYYGKGKRTGFYGAFLLACYDEETEQYQTICKIGTGFKDEDLVTQSESLKKFEIVEPRQYYYVPDNAKNLPDVWFDAVKVWEVKAADLSISPIYKAAIGIVSDSKGIALRFPRFIREREDKDPEGATTAEQIAEMYQGQFTNE